MDVVEFTKEVSQVCGRQFLYDSVLDKIYEHVVLGPVSNVTGTGQLIGLLLALSALLLFLLAFRFLLFAAHVLKFEVLQLHPNQIIDVFLVVFSYLWHDFFDGHLTIEVLSSVITLISVSPNIRVVSIEVFKLLNNLSRSYLQHLRSGFLLLFASLLCLSFGFKLLRFLLFLLLILFIFGCLSFLVFSGSTGIGLSIELVKRVGNFTTTTPYLLVPVSALHQHFVRDVLTLDVFDLFDKLELLRYEGLPMVSLNILPEELSLNHFLNRVIILFLYSLWFSLHSEEDHFFLSHVFD